MNRLSQYKVIIPFRGVAVTAYAILIIPTLLFFAGWLKWYWAILFSGILLIGAYCCIKKDYWCNVDKIEVSLSVLTGAGIAFTLWVLISGSCYFSQGNWDTIWRNTIFYDLVNRKWPVYYPEKNGYLCYYFAFWMVPALFGKLFGGRLDVAFFALACWFIIILFTVFLLIAYYFRNYKKNFLRTIVLFMIMWSGINILGMFLVNHLGIYSPAMHWGINENYCDYFWVDGEAFNFYYRSNEDFICENYNQIPIWIATALMLQNRKIHNYAFIGLLLFPFSPWGTVGIAALMIADALRFTAKHNIILLLKEALSVQNVCALFSVFLVFVTFFSNQNLYADKENYGLRLLPINKMTPQMWQGVLIFWLCEFGIYYYFLWKKSKKDHLFITMMLSLLIIPFLHIGPKGGRDFGMNVSLPAIYLLMIYMLGYIAQEWLSDDIPINRKFRVSNFLLIVMLLLSFTTPVFDWMSKISTMNKYGSISIQDKSVSSFADLLGYEGIFLAPISENADESIFFEFFAKKLDRKNYDTLPISENLSEIRNIDDINQYLDYLTEKNCTVFIAIRDIPGYYLTQETINKIKLLGFSEDMDILLQKEYHSFIGISNNGQVLTEQIGGDEYITHYGEGQIDGSNVWMESGTWNYGNCAVINIDDGHYSANGRGLNIVVKDNTANRVIDSVAFDTHNEVITCTRKLQ